MNFEIIVLQPLSVLLVILVKKKKILLQEFKLKTSGRIGTRSPALASWSFSARVLCYLAVSLVTPGRG